VSPDGSGRQLRIAMLCPRLPYPPNKGEKIRALHHLRYLGRRHDVTLISLVDDSLDLEHLPVLRALARRIATAPVDRQRARIKSLRGLLTGRPLTLEYFACPALARRVRELVTPDTCDLVLVYSSAMAQYVAEIRGIPVVADIVDMDSGKWRQFANRSAPPLAWLFGREADRMRAYERDLGDTAHTVILVSEREAAAYRALAPRARVAVVPLAIDTEYFAPDPAVAAAPAAVVFTGVMDYRPNVDAVQYFADEILPRIRREEPDTRFLVVGQRPAPAIQRLGRRPGIEVTGAVSDVRPYLRQARVSVAPFRIAQGMQTKVLEAMAMAMPVVATPKASEGIEAQPGRDLAVEIEPAGFAEQVTRLLRDSGSRAAMGQHARAFVEAHHGPTRVMAELNAVLVRASVNAGPGAGPPGFRTELGAVRLTGAIPP
jgi:sugar transferase (PEP-CTERM/EpsH1 system associated)